MADNRGGGVDQEPMAKRQRTLTEAELEGPIEDEETARETLRGAGFRLGNFTEAEDAELDSDGGWRVNPICHFAGVGDLKMCRYLLTQGATTTDDVFYEGDIEWFPMLAAAKLGMKEGCQWLYNHGAQQDICRVIYDRQCPLEVALSPWDCFNNPPHTTSNRALETAHWLIFNGAIPSDKEGNMCESFMSRAFAIRNAGMEGSPAFNRKFEGCKRLLSWAENSCSTHSTYSTFLQGTFCHMSNQERLSSPAQCLDGHEGIRQKIAKYIGVLTGRNLRIVRGIVKPLKKALADGEKGSSAKF